MTQVCCYIPEHKHFVIPLVSSIENAYIIFCSPVFITNFSKISKCWKLSGIQSEQTF